MEWVTDSQGNIIVNQLRGWTMAPALGTSVLLQLRFEGQSKAGEIRERAVQIALRADNAAQLARELAEVAAQILAAKPSQPPN